MVTSIWTLLPTYGAAAVLEGARLGIEKSHLAGDSWVMGGCFVADPDEGIVFAVSRLWLSSWKLTCRLSHFEYQHREQFPGDWTDMDSLVTQLKINNASIESLRFDHEKAFKRWMSLRQRARDIKCEDGKCS